MQKISTNPLVTRFAPSPTGHLHLGHILSLAYIFGIAEQLNARILLRIEDHDKERCKEEYVQSILNDIEWLGLLPANWDDIQTSGRESSYRQSFRPERYALAIERLKSEGLIYYCQCSRVETFARLRDSPFRDELYYDGFCRAKSFSEGQVRMLIPSKKVTFRDGFHGMCTQNPARQCGDMQLVDRFNNNTYNFAVVVDDIHEGVNVIVRGTDLLTCTARQCVLREKLGQSEMPAFFHHPLIFTPDGHKLSKRLKSTGLEPLRNMGMQPCDVLGLAFHQAGIIESVQPIDQRKLSELCKIALP